MAEGIRTEDGKRIVVLKRLDDDVEGQGRYNYLRPATADDVEGQGRFNFLRPATADDVEGQGRFNGGISPVPIDADEGLYLAVIDGEDDVTGNLRFRTVREDDTEGQGRYGYLAPAGSEDTEGQVYRQRDPRGGGEDGRGAV